MTFEPLCGFSNFKEVKSSELKKSLIPVVVFPKESVYDSPLGIKNVDGENVDTIVLLDKFVFLKKNDVMNVNDKAYVIINSLQLKETLEAFGHNEKISNKIKNSSFEFSCFFLHITAWSKIDFRHFSNTMFFFLDYMCSK